MTNRPNFILLQGEDAGRALGCYGDPDAKTPNLDRLAGEGCRYDQGFTTCPVSAPSRCTMVTGQYAFSIGTHHMRSHLLDPPRLFTQKLRDAGYYVNWANKTDFNFMPPDDFADDRNDWRAMLAKDKLPEKPFFLYHNFAVTHESTSWGPVPDGGWSAANERVAEEHRLTRDQWTDPLSVRVPAYLPDTTEVRNDIARFYNAMAIEDHQVGEMLAALDASPHRDNTIVIYLTDHGRGLMREKRWPYEAGIHLSLLIRAPGLIEPGSVSDELVSWVDLAPTILSLAGVPIPEHYQGQVFLGPDKAAPRDCVFAHRDRMGETFDRVRAVRERRYHYVRNFFPQLPYAQRCWYMDKMATVQVMRELHAQDRLAPEQARFMAETRPEEELYDAVADPDMVHNLAADPAHADALERLRGRLDAFLDDVPDLAVKSERELIDEGLVADKLGEFGDRLKPLPERYALGNHRTSILEMPE